jgi:hypothetical protein
LWDTEALDYCFQLEMMNQYVSVLYRWSEGNWIVVLCIKSLIW